MESWRTPGQVVILIALFALMGTGSFASEEKTGEFKLLRDENTETVEGCTIEKFRILSPAMNREIKALVVLPPEYKNNTGKKYPILYTLHGAKSPIDRYITMTPVLLRALKDKPMIVTCMDVDGLSWYLDSPYLQDIARGKDSTKVKSLFTTFFFEEFIPCLDQNYRINSKQRMLTGNSMGGFGAFHYMLTKPELFVSVSSLSGLFEKTDADKKWEPLLGSIREFPERHRSADIFEHLKSVVQKGLKLPKIYMICGTEDPLLPHNRAMQSLLKEKGIAFEYQESPGKHGWAFWSDKLPGVIDFHWRSLSQ